MKIQQKDEIRLIFQLSPIEQIIMDLFWEQNQWMSGANVWTYFNQHHKPYERSTINTYLMRMTEKGLLIKKQRKYIYAYTKQDFEKKKAEEVLSVMYNGSLTKFLSALNGSKQLTDTEKYELEAYLEQQE